MDTLTLNLRDPDITLLSKDSVLIDQGGCCETGCINTADLTTP